MAPTIDNPYQSPDAAGKKARVEVELLFTNDEVEEFPAIKQHPLSRESRTPRGCPSCHHPRFTKVSFTIWGGFIGPRLLNHVKCNECGTTFNRRSGKSNLIPIIIYGVVLSVVLLLFIHTMKQWLLEMVQS